MLPSPWKPPQDGVDACRVLFLRVFFRVLGREDVEQRVRVLRAGQVPGGEPFAKRQRAVDVDAQTGEHSGEAADILFERGQRLLERGRVGRLLGGKGGDLVVYLPDLRVEVGELLPQLFRLAVSDWAFCSASYCAFRSS